MAKITKWGFPHYDEMIIVTQPGNGLPELRSCLFGIDKLGNVAKTLYCSRYGQFFTREKDGWHMQLPHFGPCKRQPKIYANSSRGISYPHMRNFGNIYCHALVAFAWCRRPLFVELPDGYYRLCYMDYERGRMYYKDLLLDAKGNKVKDKDGNYVIIDIYLQVDHLNGKHDDYCAGNLEYVTSFENQRRAKISRCIKKNGIDPKTMTYRQLRYAFMKSPYMSLDFRIHLICAMVRDDFSPKL